MPGFSSIPAAALPRARYSWCIKRLLHGQFSRFAGPSRKPTMQTDIRIPWVVVVSLPQPRGNPPAEKNYAGDGHEILLQGFHWSSASGVYDPHRQAHKNWYAILRKTAATIKNAGFS